MSAPSQSRAVPLPLLAETETLVRPRLPSDEEAMSLLRSRDGENALRILFERYSKLVFSIGLRILRDLSEAEEVVQEVFMYLFEKSALFDPRKGSAKSWIVQLSFHRALDRQAYLAKRVFQSGTEIGSLADTLSGGVDLEREIGARLTHERIRRAFDELSDRQRRTIALFFFEGMDFHEIAETLNEPVANARHYYYRGLDKLRKSSYVKGLREACSRKEK